MNIVVCFITQIILLNGTVRNGTIGTICRSFEEFLNSKCPYCPLGGSKSKTNPLMTNGSKIVLKSKKIVFAGFLQTF